MIAAAQTQAKPPKSNSTLIDGNSADIPTMNGMYASQSPQTSHQRSR